jgi:hypothetical protein
VPTRARGLRRSAALRCSITLSRLARPVPEEAAEKPAAREVWVERHCNDRLTPSSRRCLRRNRPSAKAAFARTPGSSPATSIARRCEISVLQTVRVRIFAPAVNKQSMTAERGPGECRLVTQIACGRLFKQRKRVGDARCRRPNHGIGAQIEVVGGQVGGRAAGRTPGLGGMQSRLDYDSNVRSHLVLEVENILQRAVELVGPEMCPARRVDQLRRVMRTRSPPLRTEPSRTYCVELFEAAGLDQVCRFSATSSRITPLISSFSIFTCRLAMFRAVRSGPSPRL